MSLMNPAEKVDLAYKVVKEYYDGKKSNYKTIKSGHGSNAMKGLLNRLRKGL